MNNFHYIMINMIFYFDFLFFIDLLLLSAIYIDIIHKTTGKILYINNKYKIFSIIITRFVKKLFLYDYKYNIYSMIYILFSKIFQKT